MRILVACEESQAITKELRKLGHEAYSCDILPCSGGHPEWHYQQDVFEVIDKGWDMMIAHPPCTYLAVSGARWLYNKDGSRNEERWKNQEDALDFVRKLMDASIDKIAIENPISIMSTKWRKPDQIIQPWMFGHGETKATCLWLKNLPKLVSTNIVEGREARVHRMAPGPNRWKERSRTYQGIADAMAEQWG